MSDRDHEEEVTELAVELGTVKARLAEAERLIVQWRKQYEYLGPASDEGPTFRDCANELEAAIKGTADSAADWRPHSVVTVDAAGNESEPAIIEYPDSAPAPPDERREFCPHGLPKDHCGAVGYTEVFRDQRLIRIEPADRPGGYAPPAPMSCTFDPVNYPHEWHNLTTLKGETWRVCALCQQWERIAETARAAPEPTMVVANYATEIYRGPPSGWAQFKLEPGVLYNLTAKYVDDSADEGLIECRRCGCRQRAAIGSKGWREGPMCHQCAVETGETL